MDIRIESCLKAYIENRKSRRIFSRRRGNTTVYPEPMKFQISEKLKAVINAIIPSEEIPLYWKFCACFSVYHSSYESSLIDECRNLYDRGVVDGEFNADHYISLPAGFDGAFDLDISRYPMIMDPMISSFILELNRQRYFTLSSCSDHSWENILSNGWYKIPEHRMGSLSPYDWSSWIEVNFKNQEDDSGFENHLAEKLRASGLACQTFDHRMKIHFWYEEELEEGQEGRCLLSRNLTSLLSFSSPTIFDNLMLIAAEMASEDDSWIDSIAPMRKGFGNRFME